MNLNEIKQEGIQEFSKRQNDLGDIIHDLGRLRPFDLKISSQLISLMLERGLANKTESKIRNAKTEREVEKAHSWFYEHTRPLNRQSDPLEAQSA